MIKMMSVTKKAYGKVNLFLSVSKLRADGRHVVENVMCRVGVYDTVTVEKTDMGITLDCGCSGLPISEDNLAYLAAKCYMERYDVDSGVSIKIEKRIPIKAGMAGGSTDCAAVLMGLNDLFGRASLDELVEMGSEMGADVPFFLYETPVMLGRGTGTSLTPFPKLKGGLYGLFVTHGQKQSTGAMFSLLDRTRGGEFEPKSSDALRIALEKGSLEETLCAMHNDFEICTEHFGEVKDALCAVGAKKAMLSGSGPTVFGVYESEADAKAAASVISYPSFVCKIGI